MDNLSMDFTFVHINENCIQFNQIIEGTALGMKLKLTALYCAAP